MKSLAIPFFQKENHFFLKATVWLKLFPKQKEKIFKKNKNIHIFLKILTKGLIHFQQVNILFSYVMKLIHIYAVLFGLPM